MCERGSLGFVSTSVIFAAFFIGSIIVSTFSDKFGRKRPLFICGFLCCLVHFISAFSPAFWFFALCRAILGFMIGKFKVPFIIKTTFVAIYILSKLNRWCSCLLSPVQTGNVWRSNVFKHCLVTKHFPVWTPCLVLLDRV